MKSRVLQQDSVNGFSYSFTRALFDKLKKLKKEDRIFRIGWKKTKGDERLHALGIGDFESSRKSSFTDIAYSIIKYLEKQIGSICIDNTDGIESYIRYAEDFLATFEISKK